MDNCKVNEKNERGKKEEIGVREAERKRMRKRKGKMRRKTY